jgi:hypothetical protein
MASVYAQPCSPVTEITTTVTGIELLRGLLMILEGVAPLTSLAFLQQFVEFVMKSDESFLPPALTYSLL